MIERYFRLSEAGSNVRTEVLAGVTTFLTMSYIVFVNPSILAETGMDAGAVFVATCVASAVGALIMGLLANYPIATAPGMGLNAFFTYTVVLGSGYTWQQALTAVFISGVLFFLLSLTTIRERLIEGIPKNLKVAISAGIGLFLGLIALKNAGITVDDSATLVSLGDLTAAPAILTLFGLALIVGLESRGFLGSVLIAILVATAAGIPLGLVEWGGILAMPPDPSATVFAFDFSLIGDPAFLLIVFTFLFVDFFDTAGTLVGVTHRAGLLDADGRLPRAGRALIADSGATVIGATLGTSPVTSYIESAAGTAVGGRTGLTAVVVAGGFLLALFFAPLASMVPAYATAAALLYVAVLMARGLSEVDWDDVTESAPAVMAAVAMPLTHSISNGIGFGFVTFVAAKVIAGRGREVGLIPWAVAALYVVKWMIGE